MTDTTVALAGQIVTVGVDTHSDIHVAVALDQLGRRLGSTTIPTTPTGYQELEAWARQLGDQRLRHRGHR
jgi:transposase